MVNNIYGYVCLTSLEYKQAKQIAELEKYCVSKSSIFVDYLSCKHTTRDEYTKLKFKLKKNDFIIVKCLEQLGDNYDEVIKELKYITCIIKAHIIVIGSNDNQLCTIVSRD